LHHAERKERKGGRGGFVVFDVQHEEVERREGGGGEGGHSCQVWKRKAGKREKVLTFSRNWSNLPALGKGGKNKSPALTLEGGEGEGVRGRSCPV